jgi:thiamine-monophosphate kinase
MRTGQHGELALLERIRRRTVQSTGDGLRLGIGDDCALLRPRPGEEIAVTTDLSIAGQHFRLDWHPAESIGHRTLARGLSDLAAMGARPIAAFLSLGLPRELAVASVGPRRSSPGRFSLGRSSWVDRFLSGFLALAESHEAPLAGGDLAESPIAMADIVLVGAVPRDRALLRSGAHAGDLLYVTGSLGGAAAGLSLLGNLMASRKTPLRRIPGRWQRALASHLYPQPRLAQGLYLQRRRLASAAIDLSDGLSTDLSHLCAESAVSAEVNADAIPIDPGAILDQALNGGEDYELLFTAKSTARIPSAIADVPVTCIGRIVPARRDRPQVTLKTSSGDLPLEPRGWQHFA